MRLATTTWGAGDRVALLLHGMLGSAAQYWQLGPALATRGYRAVAVDLPGHGDSPSATSFRSVVDSVTETMGSQPDLAIGHSFGGAVLAAALPTFRPAKVVYVDIPFTSDSQPPDPVQLRQDLEAAKAGRTADSLRHTRPEWSEQDRIVEADAARRFDVGTAVAVNLTYAAGPFPAPQTVVPSLLVCPEPTAMCQSRELLS
ncbi:alpha/beta fold hydrolase [Kribbella sp. DT2]|uniref:alpha/beta fold hydrolase n=1 Tax=Kribbella sp. DT2 TaxID=3393427 RepID=UPI003CF67348